MHIPRRVNIYFKFTGPLPAPEAINEDLHQSTNRTASFKTMDAELLPTTMDPKTGH